MQAAITQAQAQLPVDLPSPPTFTKTNPNDQPIMYIALTSDTVTEGQLYDYANTQVGERISILPGVSQVAVYGTQSAVRIKADPSAMAARDITVDDLANAIKNGTSYTGAGQFDGAHRTLPAPAAGPARQAADYDNLIVGQQQRRAGLSEGCGQGARHACRTSASTCASGYAGYSVPSATVVVAVFRQAGSNAVAGRQSGARLASARFSASCRVPSTSCRSTTARTRSSTARRTSRRRSDIAFALVVLVIFLFLGRAADTLIPAVALPLSLLLTFVVMNMLGYSLDNLSLMALTLAIGFLVDDAIVFLENTVRLMEEGQGALEATLNFRQGNQLHDSGHDHLAGGGVHPAGVHDAVWLAASSASFPSPSSCPSSPAASCRSR